MLLFTASSSLHAELSDQLGTLRADTIRTIATVIRQKDPSVESEVALAIAYSASGIGEQLGRWWLDELDTQAKVGVLLHGSTERRDEGGSWPSRTFPTAAVVERFRLRQNRSKIELTMSSPMPMPAPVTIACPNRPLRNRCRVPPPEVGC